MRSSTGRATSASIHIPGDEQRAALLPFFRGIGLIPFCFLIGAGAALAQTSPGWTISAGPAGWPGSTANVRQHHSPWVDTAGEENLGKWIGLAGTVHSSRSGEFRLEHEDGVVPVDVSAFGSGVDTVLVEDQEVHVTGLLKQRGDGAIFIQATSLYIPSSNTNFFARAGAASAPPHLSLQKARQEVVRPREITGTVTGVEGASVTLLVDDRAIDVDTSELAEDITDDEGLVKVQVGSRVSVRGSFVEAAPSETPTFRADSILLLPKRHRAPADES